MANLGRAYLQPARGGKLAGLHHLKPYLFPLAAVVVESAPFVVAERMVVAHDKRSHIETFHEVFLHEIHGRQA